MKYFLDSVMPDEIRFAYENYCIDGVTTNPKHIKLSGKPVDENFRVPLVAYTGDTTAAGLDKFPDMYRAKVLICEATFLEAEHSPEKIHRNGHVHLNDIIDRADRFENELVILGHFSTRYFEDQVRKIIDKRLPRPLWEKVMAWV